MVRGEVDMRQARRGGAYILCVSTKVVNELLLVPRPRRVEALGGVATFDVNALAQLVALRRRSLLTIAAELPAWIRVEIAGASCGTSASRLQGYTLAVDDRGVRIECATPAGLGHALATLAPLHQPHNLMGVRAIAKLRPDLKQIACFDTAFHRTQPELNRRLPLPDSYFDAGVERYGFHGLSYAWLAREIARLRGATPKRTLAFHLGAGSSACALLDGRSHDTSMGFSTVDGLMMATRPGALDAGVILHLLGQGATRAELADLLYTRSGLRGVSGFSADMKTLLASDDPRALRAIDMFCRRAAIVGAGLAVSMGGLDCIVFTGGIGEHAPAIRAKIVALLALLGASIDPARNTRNEARISRDGAPVECWIVNADEEREIAEATAVLA